MDPSSLVRNRTGFVLAKNSILKSCHLKMNAQNGCNPNFRRAGQFAVYGAAQSNFDGIKNTLNFVLKENDNSKVVWVQVRVEPIVYIGGHPFILREIDQPFSNILLKKIAVERLQKLEDRLKNDVIQEACNHDGLVLVHDEEDGKLVPRWLKVAEPYDSPLGIRTPLELFDALKKQHPENLVQYYRIPFGREFSFSSKDMEDLLNIISTHCEDPKTAFIFSSQTGINRTTLSMVMTCLYMKKITQPTHSHSLESTQSNSDNNVTPHNNHINNHNENNGIQSSDSNSKNNSPSKAPFIEHNNLVLKVPPVIHSLLRLLEGGHKSQRETDHIIDLCSMNVHDNIRHVIALGLSKGNKYVLASEYLSRVESYMSLIMITEYLDSLRLNNGLLFTSWLAQRPGILGLIELIQQQPKRAILVDTHLVSPHPTLHPLTPLRNKSPSSSVSHKTSEAVMEERNGILLGPSTILKVDYMPSHQDSKLSFHLPGATNFRTLNDNIKFPIYGVAQPTIPGLRAMIKQVTANRKSSEGKPYIVFIQLRDEPLVFINNTPYVLRDTNQPFKPFVGTRIDKDHLHKLEERAALDVKDEIEKFNGAVMIHVELKSNKIKPKWVYKMSPYAYENLDGSEGDDLAHTDFMKRMSKKNNGEHNNALLLKEDEEIEEEEEEEKMKVRTPAEVFEYLSQKENCTIQYVRIPMPYFANAETSDLETILEVCSKAPSDSIFMFSCQNGIGRTSMGMVIGCMIEQFLKNPPQKDEFPPESYVCFLDPMNPDQARYKSGDYQVILNLTRVLECGLHAKCWVDYFINACDKVINIREEIYRYKCDVEKATDKTEGRFAEDRYLHYLERYYILILFQSYLMENVGKKADGASIFSQSFSDWVKERPEINKLLDNLRENPNDDRLIEEETKTLTVSASKIDKIIANRWGMVLGKYSILKSDHFPGCFNMKLPIQIEGAPNFRRIDGFPVFGVGQATVPAIRKVLEYLGVAPNNNNTENSSGKKNKVIWSNLREEATIYILGAPYVLRDLKRVFKNLIITSIDTDRLEKLEARLKSDVLLELQQFDGKILLHGENASGIEPFWVDVEDANDPNGMGIHTPLEIYEILVNQGYNVDYARIPITDEQAPEEKDFDTMVKRFQDTLQSGAENVNPLIVFNCQMGRGRTTTGTVIGCLACSLLEGLCTPPPTFISNIPQDICIVSHGKSEDYLNGDFNLIIRLAQILEGGLRTKAIVDQVINVCGTFQNLRTCIFAVKEKIPEISLAASTEWSNKNAALYEKIRTACEVTYFYLIRYFYLIAFCEYLQDFSLSSTQNITFVEWMEARSEIQLLLSESRKNLRKALR
eukprot:TRINITY_DN6298_c0_g1_i8.p1 TRINITY_DN6298_c0_g1~~TRINITY_DN6298_c0_g1_i8.p1  ORF type:complete len:1335 (+),score=311.73 TRINITY_DN6298_c0_g1_i8:1509-5513(+)